MDRRRVLGCVLALACLALLLRLLIGAPQSPESVRLEGSSGPTAGPSLLRPWFPLAPGAVWRYRIRRGDGSVDEKVYQCLNQSDPAAGILRVQAYQGAQIRDYGRLVPLDRGGWRYVKGEQRGELDQIFLPAGFGEGAEWDLHPDSSMKSLSRRRSARALYLEEVSVPALGKSVEALKVRYLRGVAEYQVRWFVRGIGIVREELPAGSSWGEASQGRVVMELVEYRPGRGMPGLQ